MLKNQTHAQSVASDSALSPHADRFFDPDPAILRAARAIYEETCGLPLVCPHGHVDPRVLAEDVPFSEPTALIIKPDHYIFRLLYSRGVPMEALGIPTRDGSTVETDPRRVWQLFGQHYFLFSGTPTRLWLDAVFHDVFGIRAKLSGETAMAIYDEIAEKLATPEFRPRALFDRFNIAVLTTTDAAADSLQHHRTIRDSDWGAHVLPCFRPDAMMRIASADWRTQVDALAVASGRSVDSYDAFIGALEERRAFFKSMGATSTDHAVLEPLTRRLPNAESACMFERALRGEASMDDQRRFEAHMLMEMARMSTEDGLVMQIHPGALRDHHTSIGARFGPDVGGDIPVRTEFTQNLHELLNAYGAHANLTLVLYALDESTYARELAPLAGHYPALRLGSPWWFHDSIEGMTRFRRRTTETAGIYNTAGFNDDTRAFCSIPARHDLARRVDANFLGGLVARHVVDLTEARAMARALAYDLPRETYKLSALTPRSRDAVALNQRSDRWRADGSRTGAPKT